MKIEKIIFNDTGPLYSKTYDFTDEWTGDITDKILFSGPNGTGKSMMLKAIAMLWDALGIWLDTGKTLPEDHPSKAWLSRWGGIAIILRDIPIRTRNNEAIGLVYGNSGWFKTVRDYNPAVNWVGETYIEQELTVMFLGNKPFTNSTYYLANESWFDEWSNAYKRLVLTFDEVNTPNVIYLDAEERRWVNPTKNIGKTASEDPIKRWLVKYQPTDDWETQLESSLISLKITRLTLFDAVLRDLNTFLIGKQIDPDIRFGENRLRVKLQNAANSLYQLRGHGDSIPQRSHLFDELSAGEHQVLILIYLLSRWLQPGGIVLIDEPDLYLHPSLVAGLLSVLERITRERNGQLLVTSHNPDVWNRYETIGRRVKLGGENG